MPFKDYPILTHEGCILLSFRYLLPTYIYSIQLSIFILICIYKYSKAVSGYVRLSDAYHCEITTLLVKDNRGNFSFHQSVGHEPLEQAALDVAVNQDHATVRLESDREQVSGLVDGELARDAAAGRELLDERQVSGTVVDGEAEDGVGHDIGAVAGIKVCNVEGVLSTG